MVIGFAERTPEGLANSVACFDRDGSARGVYRKNEPVRKRGRGRLRRPDEELLIAELAGRRVAPLICFDIEFPEPARQVTLAGADLLVTASANMEPYYLDHAIGTVARAHENRRPHLYANTVGRGRRPRLRRREPLDRARRARRRCRGRPERDEELLLVPVAEPGRHRRADRLSQSGAGGPAGAGHSGRVRSESRRLCSPSSSKLSAASQLGVGVTAGGATPRPGSRTTPCRGSGP